MLSGKLHKGGNNGLVGVSLGARRRLFEMDAFRGAFLNRELPSRKDEIEAERQTTIARMEELDPDLVAKWKREGML
jgi:hypothetical protein